MHVFFFQNLTCGGENSVFLVLGKSSENQFGRPKKKVDENFLKILPPGENPRSASFLFKN